MKQKFLCSLLSLCLLCSLPLTAGAVSLQEDTSLSTFPSVNLAEEIQRAQAGISDIPITDKMKSTFSAMQIASDGTADTVEVLYTVRDLGMGAKGNMYALTATAGTQKTEPGVESTEDPSFVDVRVSATLYWTDNLGLGNTLDRVSGSWDCYDGAWLSNRTLKWTTQNAMFVTIAEDTINLYSNSFDVNINEEGHRLYAGINARCHPASDTTGDDWVLLRLNLASHITT